ncbi:hypothetical protein PYCCODRAFT_1484590 [Trametes coccinea BRFM310]|uniref:Uncharacterized protein n=1 Tax=Trametes coccinea (strain BRFM310) TaxID=1353009 RepID=A0A1Y2J5L8_TRAC3|nr:hypothetical protein PYCCODRAFT_1484590 [Trametes coccinea BRFM310]
MFERLPTPSSGLRNPFIVLRFVLFAILLYVNLLTIGFAVWNISVLRSLKAASLGAPTFVIFNACLLLTLLAVCLASSWYSHAAFSKVRYECVWTGLLSALQLASSIDVTVNGPPALCQGISITACASSSLMVALSWISSTMSLLYSFSLLTTTITHMSVVPDIWTSSVHAVPWFIVPSDAVEARMPSEVKPRYSDVVDIKRSSLHFPTPIFEQHAKALPLSPKSAESPTTPPIWQARRSSIPAADAPSSKRTTWTNRIVSGATTLTYKRSVESMRPSWAKRAEGRRGVDHPFSVPRPAPKPVAIRPLRTLKLKSCWSQSTLSSHRQTTFSAIGSPRSPPALPPKARVAGAAPPHLSGAPLSPSSTFYIDLEQNAVVPVGAVRPVSYGMFPEDVVDPDVPITRSQPSEWVRADNPASSR